MKCSNPHCNRCIGLIAHRRGWFDERRYCSKECRNTLVAQRPKMSRQERSATTYVEWLFLYAGRRKSRRFLKIQLPPQRIVFDHPRVAYEYNNLRG
jgi:hypothetical protein